MKETIHQQMHKRCGGSIRVGSTKEKTLCFFCSKCYEGFGIRTDNLPMKINIKDWRNINKKDGIIKSKHKEQ